MEMNESEILKQQNLIIKIQSNVINDLLALLMQHISAEEAENLPCIDKINLAAKIRAEISLENICEERRKLWKQSEK